MSTMAARNIPLAQLYPASDRPVALNVCGDPDSGNFVVKPDFSLGWASKKTKRGAKPQSNAAAIGPGATHCAGPRRRRTTSARPSLPAFLQRSAYPQVWVHSPIQSSGETNKFVGTPIVRGDMRQHLKRLRFDAQITDPALRRFVGEEVWRATLQPASTFMNSLRERLSPAARAASGGARNGGSERRTADPETKNPALSAAAAAT
jgi:hypothetical protein